MIEKFRRAYDMAEEDRAHGALSQAASGLARISGFNKDSVRLEDDRSSRSDKPAIGREIKANEAKLLTPERIKAAIKADPAVMGLLDKWEKAEQRVRSARERGKPDFAAVMCAVEAKGELTKVLEQIRIRDRWNTQSLLDQGSIFRGGGYIGGPDMGPVRHEDPAAISMSAFRPKADIPGAVVNVRL